jgi:hypothetical protein
MSVDSNGYNSVKTFVFAGEFISCQQLVLQILKRQASRFHYGSKSLAVTITVFITILEQNR